MSKIVHAEKIVLSNEKLSKKELVELISKELNVTVANARVYVYNVNKRLNNSAKTVTEHLAPVISEEVKQIVKRNAPKLKRTEGSKVLDPVSEAA
jgi:hypothetical protein